MSTSTWSTPIDHSSNAGFQAWASELFTQITTVNTGQLTQTADTGQLATPVVAARPGTSTAAGYWIFKWDDGSSTPLYFKLEVGTGTAAALPAMWITCGTGSNGSGTLTGAVTTRQLTVGGTVSSTVTNRTSYLCCATGAFSLVWKTNQNGSQAGAFFSTVRSIDDSGVVNNDGYVNYAAQSVTTISAQSVNMSNNVVFSSLSGAYCLLPYAITSSVVSGNAQYFRHFAAYPLGRPLGHIATIIPSEFGVGTTFAGESGSITDHTFLSTGSQLGSSAPVGSGGIAILWQ